MILLATIIAGCTRGDMSQAQEAELKQQLSTAQAELKQAQTERDELQTAKLKESQRAARHAASMRNIARMRVRLQTTDEKRRLLELENLIDSSVTDQEQAARMESQIITGIRANAPFYAVELKQNVLDDENRIIDPIRVILLTLIHCNKSIPQDADKETRVGLLMSKLSHYFGDEGVAFFATVDITRILAIR